MLKVLCQNYTCSYPKYFATTNYLRTFEVLTYKFLLFYSHYLYIYAHWGANLTSCTHLHLKRNFHAIYLHLRGNSTSYIHLGSILMPFWHGYIFWKAPYATYPQIYIFWKAFLRYLSYIYRFLKCIICYSFTLCSVFLCHIYSHIYIPLKGIFHAT